MIITRIIQQVRHVYLKTLAKTYAQFVVQLTIKLLIGVPHVIEPMSHHYHNYLRRAKLSSPFIAISFCNNTHNAIVLLRVRRLSIILEPLIIIVIS